MKKANRQRKFEISYATYDSGHEFHNYLIVCLDPPDEPSRHWACKKVAESWGFNAKNQKAFAEQFLEDGSTLTGVGLSLLKYVQFREIKPIRILLERGQIQDIQCLPPHRDAEVWDYDLKDFDKKAVEKDEDGCQFLRIPWQ